MKRVLFVDDEKNVLNGLRRMLRSVRDKWDMDFAPGGAEALEMISQKEYDVVVSDMRMPGMDGAELLARVQATSPMTVRIILSGHSDQNMVMKSVKPAHQFLSKPCSSELLLQTLDDAYRLRRLLNNPKIKAVVSRTDSLPSMPGIYHRITQELESPSSTLDHVGKIISEDVAMTAMILKMVNSSFFGFFRRITTPGQAVSMLGVEVIKGLILSAHLFSAYTKHTAAPSFSIDTFMKHSLLVSKLAEAIATTENTSKDFQGQCATAGLLHDMGKLLLSTELPEQYEEVLAAVKAGQQLDWEVENSLLETTHGEVGAYLLGLWGLSGGTIEAIAFHHTPAECPGDDFTMLEAIHAADYFEYKLLNLGNGCERELDMVHLRNCGLEARVPVWEKACANVIDEVKRHEQ